ncbi:pyridoxal-phosphate dependent enzyme [Streptomyces sp. NPDC058369]|uniref:threonine synthase n=2 Tax=unclassified Streptomyces TaxID=2593676 RepID=UPI00339FD74D
MGEVVGSRRAGACELLEYRYGPQLLPDSPVHAPGMWRYSGLLPLEDGPIRYPLPVGGTPLIASPGLRRDLEMPRLWVKDETRGPSASNKDRATALVIETGLRTGADTITISSTGNAAVATAFGAAAAGLRSVIFVPQECNPGKIALMQAAGALVLRAAGGYPQAFRLSREGARRLGWLDRNTGVNPLTLEAKKTVALEIWEQLGRSRPDVVLVPVGDGPTLCGLAKGFRELLLCGAIDRVPRLIGVQAANCRPLVRAWLGEPADAQDHGPTIADGIAVTEPSIGPLALQDVRDSDGAYVAVTDEDLQRAVSVLARSAGVGSEPAGAACLAGLWKALELGHVERTETAVLLVTGRELAHAAHPGALTGQAPVVAGWNDVEEHLALL